MADTEITVIGAGVVGLAVAARLAPRHKDLVVLERNPRHGVETSSRNSEVIHAGMYYPRGSLKARLCVEGNRRLYEECERHGIPHQRMGKLIVASSAEDQGALEDLLARGQANGVELRMLTAAEVQSLEPHVASAGALLSPNTGIVSAHALMDHYFGSARANGAVVQPRSRVVAIERRDSDYRLTVEAGGQTESFTSERVVNAAGLGASQVAALAGIDVEAAGYRLWFCKGSYFSVTAAKSRLVSRLIYPLPGPVSLGLHAVVGLEGRLRFGPDVEYVDEQRFDYRVDPAKRAAFAAAAARLVPSLREDDLEPDISGIRPKLQGPGQPVRDFVIAEESERGLPGFVNLIGIDSPGLTSAPAIAAYVETLVRG
jgi:L-2-hydroxyglutarate oxidase LhgO